MNTYKEWLYHWGYHVIGATFFLLKKKKQVALMKIEPAVFWCLLVLHTTDWDKLTASFLQLLFLLIQLG